MAGAVAAAGEAGSDGAGTAAAGAWVALPEVFGCVALFWSAQKAAPGASSAHKTSPHFENRLS